MFAHRSILTSSRRLFSTATHTKKSKKLQTLLLGTACLTASYFGWEKYDAYTNNNKLSQDQYTPLGLIKKQQISPDSYLLRLEVKKEQNKEYPVPSCVYIKDDAIQVMRPYTPINQNPYSDGYMDLVIKKYQDGSVSRTLTSFTPHQHKVHVRGPMVEPECLYEPKSVDEVGMIAGGTGISPMYQLICRILENPDDQTTSVWLIYGNKTEKDILLRQELDQLQAKYNDRFRVKYVLENPPSDAYERGYVTENMIRDMMLNKEKRKIYVCGPNRMLAAVCGERARDYSQGPVTGLLSELGFQSDEIWKFQ
ncbi:hypothetical protein EDC96DRAFT_108369 [Choanephora cucurbitarum]|nr:hypothetical protein EDC96DRAFT_108369 [Choanephora cucurbitarum]